MMVIQEMVMDAVQHVLLIQDGNVIVNQVFVTLYEHCLLVMIECVIQVLGKHAHHVLKIVVLVLLFHHLPDRDRDFGRVRVWGTVGWIVVGIAIGQWLLHHHTPADASAEAQQAAQFAGMADAFRLSAVLGIMLGLYCLTLPHTPPSQGQRANATFEALAEVRHNPLLTLFLLAVPISCIHQFYFVHTAEFLGRFQSG